MTLYLSITTLICIVIDLKENDHDGYDYAELPSGKTKPDRLLIKDKEVAALETVQNPYYGGEIEVGESESVIAFKAERNSLRENIKVMENEYYEP